MIRIRLFAAAALAMMATGVWAAGTKAQDAPAPLELQELRMVPAAPPAKAEAAKPAATSKPVTAPAHASTSATTQPLAESEPYVESESDDAFAPRETVRRSEADAPIAPLDPALSRALSLAPGNYYLRAGETLHDGLARWCASAGWQFVHAEGTNRVLVADINFPEGTPFREAVKETMKAYWHTNRPLVMNAWLKNKTMELKERGQ